MGFTLSKEFLWKEIGDQVVVLHFESGRYFSLNASGSIIWKGLLGNQSADQIIAALCLVFDVDDRTAGEDLSTMTQTFLQKRFLLAD